MSTVRLNKMEWGNAFSYADGNSLDLSDCPLTQIVGSNGAGKSSIPTIMEECLYNKNSKGFKKAEIPNRYLGDPYYLNMSFSVGSDEYFIDIKKASALKATLTKNGEDISAHTGSQTIKMVEDLIGLDFKTFTQLVYQNTDSSLQFLTATDSKRKEFLVNLFDLSEYGENYTIFSGLLRDIQKEVNRIEGQVDSTSSAITSATQHLNVEPPEPVDIPEFPQDEIEEKARLDASLDNITRENERISRGNRIINSLAGLRSSEEITADIEAVGEVENKSPLAVAIGEHNANIKAHKEQLAKVQSLGSVCPTCIQPVNGEFIQEIKEHNQSVIDSEREEAQKIVKKVKDIEAAEKKLKVLKNELSQRENLEKQLDFDTLEPLLNHEDLEDQISNLSSKIRSVQASIKEAEAVNKKSDAVIAKIDAAKQQIVDLESQLAEQTSKLKEYSDAMPALEVLKKAFSPTGLVAYKLENRVKDLETFTNSYLSKLSDGRFNLVFELEKDKLNVVILDGSNPVPITSLSSGEKARVVIGTLLGIRKIMQSISKTTVNVLFLDEVISVMDDEGKEQLVEVLLEERELNTFLVSHGWAHPLVKKVEVVKEDNISRLYG